MNLPIIALAASVLTVSVLHGEPEPFELEPIRIMLEKEDNPFQQEVAGWSYRLKDTPWPEGSKGNCMPVALELQDRIVRTGRMAIIVYTEGLDPDDDVGHALVLYDSDKDAQFDSVIDNGAFSKYYPRSSDGLRDGVFGIYRGRCKVVGTHHCEIITGY